MGNLSRTQMPIPQLRVAGLLPELVVGPRRVGRSRDRREPPDALLYVMDVGRTNLGINAVQQSSYRRWM